MLEISGKCVVKEVKSTRAESADAYSTSRIKINIPDLSQESAAGALACKVDDVALLFKDEEVGQPRFPGARHIMCGEAWEGQHTLKISTLKKVKAAKLQVLHMIPTERGTFDTTIMVTVESPRENYIESLSERCNRESLISVEQVQGELVDQAGEAVPAGKDEPEGKVAAAPKKKKASGKKKAAGAGKAKPRSRAKKKSLDATPPTGDLLH